jgi:hypothetical protein
MARKKITDLLDEELTESESSGVSDITNSIPLAVAEVKEIIDEKLEDSNSLIYEGTKYESQLVTESVITKVPKYLSLERKEVRLPSEHIDELTRLVRRLNRQRKGKDERITENTLIRIAVSLLVDFGEQIKGNNEEELLYSLRSEIEKK